MQHQVNEWNDLFPDGSVPGFVHCICFDLSDVATFWTTSADTPSPVIGHGMSLAGATSLTLPSSRFSAPL